MKSSLAFMRQVLRLNMALLKNPGECGGFFVRDPLGNLVNILQHA